MVVGELFTLSKTYPLISLTIAVLLFIIGFKFAKKIFWILAMITLIIALIMFFI